VVKDDEDDKVRRDDLAVSLVDAVGVSGVELAVDYAELGLDGLLEDKVLRELPVFKTLVNVSRAAGGIRDALFAKKLLRFIRGATVNADARSKFALKYADPKSRRRIGENMLLLLEKADDMVKADMLGHLFARFLLEQLDVTQLFEAARRFCSLETEDLRRLAAASLVADLDQDDLWRLSNAGLVHGPKAQDLLTGGLSWSESDLTDLGMLLCTVYRATVPPS
jgi:hypothetical protein